MTGTDFPDLMRKEERLSRRWIDPSEGQSLFAFIMDP